MSCEISPLGLRFVPLRGIPAISEGDDLAEILANAAAQSGVTLSRGILVLCQKIISKAEGRTIALSDVIPGEQAKTIAKEDDKDPRLVEVVLRETARIVRRGRGVMICETHHGFVCANAGVDLSNAPQDDTAVLLPLDCDASAQALQRRCPRLTFDQTNNQEERRLDQDVMRHVEDGPRHPEFGGQRDTEHHVADVADQGEGQQSLDVALGDRAENADHHRQ